ncbi:MAG: hypothetical protein HY720_03220 [Planctomycetes bacterium]|nr:hypothetical protein [Planctomycetota bacterium]
MRGAPFVAALLLIGLGAGAVLAQGEATVQWIEMDRPVYEKELKKLGYRVSLTADEAQRFVAAARVRHEGTLAVGGGFLQVNHMEDKKYVQDYNSEISGAGLKCTPVENAIQQGVSGSFELSLAGDRIRARLLTSHTFLFEPMERVEYVRGKNVDLPRVGTARIDATVPLSAARPAGLLGGAIGVKYAALAVVLGSGFAENAGTDAVGVVFQWYAASGVAEGPPRVLEEKEASEVEAKSTLMGTAMLGATLGRQESLALSEQFSRVADYSTQHAGGRAISTPVVDLPRTVGLDLKVTVVREGEGFSVTTAGTLEVVAGTTPRQVDRFTIQDPRFATLPLAGSGSLASGKAILFTAPDVDRGKRLIALVRLAPE